MTEVIKITSDTHGWEHKSQVTFPMINRGMNNPEMNNQEIINLEMINSFTEHAQE